MRFDIFKPFSRNQTQNGRFPCKIALLLRKSRLQSFFVWKPSATKGRTLVPVRESLAEAHPLPCKKANLQSIFARSASSVTPSEKSSMNTNRKSTTSFPMSLRWTVYIVPNLRKGWLKNVKVPKMWTVICDNLQTVRYRMPVSINHYYKVA